MRWRIPLVLALALFVAVSCDDTPVEPQVSWLAAVVSANPGPVVFSDDFDDNSLDLSLWTPILEEGATVSEVNQRLEVSSNIGGTLGAVRLNLPFPPDNFVVQVDFTMLEWSGGSYLPPGFEGDVALVVSLQDFPDDEVAYMAREDVSYEANFNLPAFDERVNVPSSDASGRFRLASDGSSFSAYYWSEGAWQLLLEASGDQPAGPVVFWFGQDAEGGATGRTAFDNFVVFSVATAEEQIEDLDDAVEDLLDEGTLDAGGANALTSKLDGAMEALDKGKTGAASNKLGAFINQVDALVKSGRLTPEEGQALINAAQTAITTINNGS